MCLVFRIQLESKQKFILIFIFWYRISVISTEMWYLSQNEIREPQSNGHSRFASKVKRLLMLYLSFFATFSFKSKLNSSRLNNDNGEEVGKSNDRIKFVYFFTVSIEIPFGRCSFRSLHSSCFITWVRKTCARFKNCPWMFFTSLESFKWIIYLHICGIIHLIVIHDYLFILVFYTNSAYTQRTNN